MHCKKLNKALLLGKRPGSLKAHGHKLPIMGLALIMAGCATYQPKPLSDHIALAGNVGDLANAEVVVGDFSETGALSMEQLASLALYNNPDLKASRAKRNVAGAQLYAAGLLPDPSFSASEDRPIGNNPGLVNAWGLGLGYDLLSLITRRAQIDSQRGASAQVNFELMWQEWLVVQKARAIAVRYLAEREQLAVLQEALHLYRQRYNKSAKALDVGDVTLDVYSADLTALVDVSSQVNRLEQAHNDTQHALNNLLGLSPGVRLSIQPLPRLDELDTDSVKQQLLSLPSRRQDLLALKAGYESQEARVRSAILSQFPSFGIGINRARDTGGLHTGGLSISLNLPVFSGNRGAIAIERASRNQLKAEYEARLIQVAVDVDKLIDLNAIVLGQKKVLEQYIPKLNALVAKARPAYERGDIDALTFLNLETTWLNKRLERISLEQLQYENRIALQTALATPDLNRTHSLPALDDGHLKGIKP